MQTLNSIDLYLREEASLELLATSPEFTEITDYSVFKTYWFNEEIPAGNTVEVSLAMVARTAGSHPLRIDICVDTSFNCLTYEGEIVVR
jgi:hypothetical protein